MEKTETLFPLCGKIAKKFSIAWKTDYKSLLGLNPISSRTGGGLVPRPVASADAGGPLRALGVDSRKARPGQPVLRAEGREGRRPRFSRVRGRRRRLRRGARGLSRRTTARGRMVPARGRRAGRAGALCGGVSRDAARAHRRRDGQRGQDVDEGIDRRCAGHAWARPRRTAGNFNNEIGLPLSVAGLDARLRLRRHRGGHQPSGRDGAAARHPAAGHRGRDAHRAGAHRVLRLGARHRRGKSRAAGEVAGGRVRGAGSRRRIFRRAARALFRARRDVLAEAPRRGLRRRPAGRRPPVGVRAGHGRERHAARAAADRLHGGERVASGGRGAEMRRVLGRLEGRAGPVAAGGHALGRRGSPRLDRDQRRLQRQSAEHAGRAGGVRESARRRRGVPGAGADAGTRRRLGARSTRRWAGSWPPAAGRAWPWCRGSRRDAPDEAAQALVAGLRAGGLAAEQVCASLRIPRKPRPGCGSGCARATRCC